MTGNFPEVLPEEIGRPVPVSPSIPSEAYTYDYIVAGGMHYYYSHTELASANMDLQEGLQDVFSPLASARMQMSPFF